MALGNHVVLQLVGPAAHQLLQPALPLLPLSLELAPQALQGRAGPVGHPASLFQGKAQLLLEIRQGPQPLQQSCGHWSQLRFIDLSAQPSCCCQGFSQLQQRFAAGAAPLGAELNGVFQVSHPLEAEGASNQPVKGEQLGRFLKPSVGFSGGCCQGEPAAEGLPQRTSCKTAEVFAQSLPLEQRQGFSLDLHDCPGCWEFRREARRASQANCLPDHADRTRRCRRGDRARLRPQHRHA